MAAKKLAFYDGSALRNYRQQLGVKQEGLAKKSGFTRAFIANYESGRRRLANDDAMKLWETLVAMAPNKAQADEALLMAIEAAASTTHLRKENVEELEHELVRVQRKLEAYKGFLAQAQADEDRLRNHTW